MWVYLSGTAQHYREKWEDMVELLLSITVRDVRLTLSYC